MHHNRIARPLAWLPRDRSGVVLLLNTDEMTTSAQTRPEVVASVVAPPWREYVPIALVTLLGIIITWSVYEQVTDWDRQRVQSLFLDAARDRVLVFQREVEHSLAVVEDIGSLFGASRWVGRRDFRKFVGPALQRHASIQALEWVPRVPAAERSTFVNDARRSFPRFRITDRGADGELVDTPLRPEHFPVLYVQPYGLNKSRLGFDLASDPAVVAVLHRASDTGRMIVSMQIPAGLDTIGNAGFVARLPVYYKDERAEKDEAEDEEGTEPLGLHAGPMLRGFAQGRFYVGDIVVRALQSLSPAGIHMALFDTTQEQGGVLLYRHVSRLASSREHAGRREQSPDSNPLVFTQTIEVMNRRWKVECTSLAGHFQVDPWSGWFVLAGGLAFTVLLTVYLATIVGRAAMVERLVGQRTLQLVNANAALNREIGDRKHAEEELHALNDTLEQRVAQRTAEAEGRAEELEQFAYVTSHDLKAPLRAISNLAAWIEEDLERSLTSDTREQLHLLRDRVRRMHALIEGLLEYSRVGRTQVIKESVDSGALVAEVIDSLGPPAGFTIQVSPDMPVLRTDRLQLGQVLANLISNSLKHHGSTQGHIRIGVQEQGAFYQFFVQDDGIGIPSEYHSKVFMMFQTLETLDYGANTGIGLALVKRIVQEHGGSIVLDSERGKGTTFRFTWPRDG